MLVENLMVHLEVVLCIKTKETECRLVNPKTKSRQGYLIIISYNNQGYFLDGLGGAVAPPRPPKLRPRPERSPREMVCKFENYGRRKGRSVITLTRSWRFPRAISPFRNDNNGGWKSGRMKNIQFSLLCVWLEGWKSGRVENSFVWLERKREG